MAGQGRLIGRRSPVRPGLSTITTYANANGTSQLNQIANTYDDSQWGRLTASRQTHSSDNTNDVPQVGYSYEDGVSSNQAKYVRLHDVTYPGASPKDRVVRHNYGTANGIDDRLSRVASVSDTAGTPTVYAEYTRIGAGTIVKIAHPAVSGGLNLTYKGASNGQYTGFDSFGRVIDQKWINDNGNTTYDRFRYGYDRNSNRTWKEVMDNAAFNTKYYSESYTYDGLDRLTEQKRGQLTGTPPGVATIQRGNRFGLTAVGNWETFAISDSGTDLLNQTREHNKANEIADTNSDGHAFGQAAGQAMWYEPQHDEAGNYLRVPVPSGGPINCNAGGMTPSLLQFRLWNTYDAWNRVVQVNLGDLQFGIISMKCQYDGLNRRIAKLSPATGSNWNRRDYYYNESWQVLEERTGTLANQTTPATYVKTQFLWDQRYIDAPVVRWNDTDGGSTAFNGGVDTMYYMTDANMNVTRIFAQDGSATERYYYEAYGNPIFNNATFTAESGTSAYQNDVLFAGYKYDIETGLYHVRNRMYHPALGRWMQRDPAGYVDGMNLYQYCLSNPNVMTDYLGLGGVVIEKASMSTDGLIYMTAWLTECTADYAVVYLSGQSRKEGKVTRVVSTSALGPYRSGSGWNSRTVVDRKFLEDVFGGGKLELVAYKTKGGKAEEVGRAGVSIAIGGSIQTWDKVIFGLRRYPNSVSIPIYLRGVAFNTSNTLTLGNMSLSYNNVTLPPVFFLYRKWFDVYLDYSNWDEGEWGKLNVPAPWLLFNGKELNDFSREIDHLQPSSVAYMYYLPEPVFITGKTCTITIPWFITNGWPGSGYSLITGPLMSPKHDWKVK